MKKITLRRPRGLIVHPNDPDVVFEVERPTRADIIAYQDEIKDYDRVQVAVDPDTHEPIRNEYGRVETVDLPTTYPMKVVIKYLEKYLKSVKGLTNDDGENLRMTIHEEKRLIMDSLMERDLDVTHVHKGVEQFKLDEEGKRVPLRDNMNRPIPNRWEVEKIDKEVTEPCLMYVTEMLHKQETYEDPLGKATSSSSPAKDDGERKLTTVETVA